MSSHNSQAFIVRLFLYLRTLEFQIGVRELIDALKGIKDGWGNTPQDCFQLLKFLWCHSDIQAVELEQAWKFVEQQTQLHDMNMQEKFKPVESDLDTPSGQIEEDAESPQDQMPEKPEEPILEEKAQALDISPLPFRVPFLPVEVDSKAEMNTYWPISPRSMVYAWRYLRHLVPDGPANVLDIEKTIDYVAQNGFFLKPTYRRRERNHASLIMFVDQNGSMTPFHRFTRDLIETASNESDIETVQVFYFANTPELLIGKEHTGSIYVDPFLTQKKVLGNVMATCSNNTSILIVSDAGAARGARNLNRIRKTSLFLRYLRKYTNLIAWLNPMPKARWEGTSAQSIKEFIPMFQMDPDGFSTTIDVLRGLTTV